MRSSDYFQSREFQKHRNNICDLLNEIPAAETPNGWVHKGVFAVGGFEYFGFTKTSSMMLVISSQGRGLYDLEKNDLIARDDSTFEIDETFLICDGFDVLQGEKFLLAGKYDGSMLPVSNSRHENLRKVSPLYPCEDLIFQPPFEDCLLKGHNKNCVRIYRGFLYCYGFSFCGNYFVIADDGGITYWERECKL